MIPQNVRKDFTVVNVDIKNHPEYIKLQKRIFELEKQVNNKRPFLFSKRRTDIK